MHTQRITRYIWVKYSAQPKPKWAVSEYFLAVMRSLRAKIKPKKNAYFDRHNGNGDLVECVAAGELLRSGSGTIGCTLPLTMH